MDAQAQSHAAVRVGSKLTDVSLKRAQRTDLCRAAWVASTSYPNSSAMQRADVATSSVTVHALGIGVSLN